MRTKHHDPIARHLNVRAWNLPVLAAILISILLFDNRQSHAQVLWDNPGGVPAPFFDLDVNWNGGVAPDVNSDIQFELPATYEVWWDSTTFALIPEVRSMLATDGDITFLNRDNAARYRLTLGGGSDSPTLSVSGAALTLSGVEVESLGDTSIGGTLTLDGSHSAGAGLIANGLAVDGLLNVSSGSSLDSTATNINGAVNISGAGSVWNASSITMVDREIVNASLTVSDGGVVTTNNFGNNILDSTSFSITIDGEGSSLSMNSSMSVGFNAAIQSGSVDVLNGGELSSNGGVVGDGGDIEVVGVGTGGSRSTWNNAGALDLNAGSIRVNSGALMTSNGSTIRSGTAQISGAGSRWENSGSLDLLNVGDERLSVTSGAVVTNMRATIQNGAGVSVNGTGSRWENAGSLEISSGSENALVIEAGGVVTSTLGDLRDQSDAVVRGAGSSWEMTGAFSALDSNIYVESGAVLVSANGSISSRLDPTSAIFTGSGTEWDNSGFVSIGDTSAIEQTRFDVLDGAVVSNTSATMSNARAIIQGPGSRWTNTASIYLDGSEVTTSIEVSDQATLESSGATLYNAVSISGSNSTNVNVGGSGSRWTNNGALGIDGGTLNVFAGGFVETSSIGVSSTGFDIFESSGWISVAGAGSTVQINGDLDIGASSFLSMTGNTLVSVSGTTSLDSNGSLSLNGGTFNFGRTKLSDLRRFGASSGTLRGTVVNDLVTELASIEDGFSPSVILDIPEIENVGTLFGSANVRYSLNNSVGAEVEVFTGEQMRWGGGAQNEGEINNFGGLVRFEGSLTNESTGFIGGRGTFIANGGIENAGVLAFTGTTDVLGDIEMLAGSQLVTSGFATTTLFDDLDHNGAEIRTSAGSALVVLGEATGAGDYTGTGTVFFEGDLRPGNSPDVVSFEGNVVMGTFADTFIELGGESVGMYDQLMIDGNFFVDGALDVALIDGFVLSAGQEFLFADVEGSLSGMFNGLDEGSLVGNYGGRDLFITYHGFGGNSGVGLFTPVPEPSSTAVLGVILAFAFSRRRRK